MTRFTIQTFILLLASLCIFRVDAQSSDEALIDFTGEWVGIIEWFSYPEPLFYPSARIYRLNIMHTDVGLRAMHVVEGDADSPDRIYTRPFERLDEPLDWGFDGEAQGTTVRFEHVQIYMGHCSVNIELEYATFNGQELLIGRMVEAPLMLPTPEHTLTPEEASHVPDMVVGCDSPNSVIVLRRFSSQVETRDG